jgi:hypothetical protein
VVLTQWLRPHAETTTIVAVLRVLGTIGVGAMATVVLTIVTALATANG